MRSYNFIFCLIVALLTQACSIKTSTHFNKNWSGAHSFYFDMSNLNKTSIENQAPLTFDSLFLSLNPKKHRDSLMIVLSEFKREIQDLGITNFIYDAEDNGIKIEYNFNDYSIFDGRISPILDRYFDSSFPEPYTADFMKLPVYSAFNIYCFRDKSWLIIDFLHEVKESLKSVDHTEKYNEPDFMVLSTSPFRFTTNFSFERKVLEIQSDIPYIQNGNEIVLEYSYGDLLEAHFNNKEARLKIKLK